MQFSEKIIERSTKPLLHLFVKMHTPILLGWCRDCICSRCGANINIIWIRWKNGMRSRRCAVYDGFDERLGCMFDIKRQRIRLYVLETVSMIIFFILELLTMRWAHTSPTAGCDPWPLCTWDGASSRCVRLWASIPRRTPLFLPEEPIAQGSWCFVVGPWDTERVGAV